MTWPCLLNGPCDRPADTAVLSICYHISIKHERLLETTLDEWASAPASRQLPHSANCGAGNSTACGRMSGMGTA